MSSNTVSQRFKYIYQALKTMKPDLKKADFAQNLGISPQVFTEILGGRMKVSVEILQKLFGAYPVSYEYIFTGDGAMFTDIPRHKSKIEVENDEENQIPPNLGGDFDRSFDRNVTGLDQNSDESIGKVVRKNVRNLSGLEEINEDLPRLNVYDLNSKAAAGMAVLVQDADKWSSVPKLSLPHLGPGFHIRLQATGESMEGTIRDGDHIVATQVLEPLLHLREGFVYVLIDKDEGVVCKRVYKGKGDILKLESDNHNYKTYTRHFSDILAVFKVREVHKTDLRNHNQRNEEFRKVWDAIEELRAKVK